jgi:single-stranded DNA-binding protein
VVCFGSLAENVCETCHKGSHVVVAGRLEDDTWTGRDGIERVSEKIIADAVGLDLRFVERQVRG